MGFGVWVSEFRDQSLGLRVKGSELGVEGLGFGVWD